MRRGLPLLVLLALAGPAVGAGDERVVLHTACGDLVLVLYPDVAPRHAEQFLKLVRLGVYDSTHFHRIHPGFVAQNAGAFDRHAPLTPEQAAAVHKLPAEFSTIPHRRGTLSMARADDDPDSAETSFSILLGDAPHLDGKYTVFGHVESGWEVLDEMVRVPRKDTAPLGRVEVYRAEVVDPAALAAMTLAGPRPLAAATSAQPATGVVELLRAQSIAAGLALLVGVGVAVFYVYPRVRPSVQRSLVLVLVLIGGFLLLVLLTPEAHRHQWLAGLLFLGLLGMFNLMSRFETPA
jgi:cyclophilin family peptidyl-prolyl cis-trans isomerase